MAVHYQECSQCLLFFVFNHGVLFADSVKNFVASGAFDQVFTCDADLVKGTRCNEVFDRINKEHWLSG